MSAEVESFPRVLVGIVTHNRARLLKRAIVSVLEQDFPNVEIAVVDDGSTDSTGALQADYPGVQWSRLAVPHGYLEARNLLMRASTATFFVSLDDDSWFLSGDEVATAVTYLEQNPRIGALAFDILSPDRSAKRSRSGARAAPTFIGCGHVVRLSAVREVGLYAPNPGTYGGEEKDLTVRLLDKGWDVHELPGVHVWHEKTSMARDSGAQHSSGVCNDLVFALRRIPLPWLIWKLPLKVASHLRFALSRRLVRPCLRGLALFITSWAAAWRTREPVRAATLREFQRRSRE